MLADGHELQIGQRRRTLRDHPRVERRPDLAVHAVVLRTETSPTPPGRSCASPENVGAMPSSGTSSGLQDTMRTKGAALVSSAGKHTTLSSTTTSGRTVARISRSRGSQYWEPAMSASQVGLMKVSSCSMSRLAELR